MTASPFCPWPYEHFFSLFMNIFMCLLGGARVLRGVSDSLRGTSLLVVARVAHWSLQPLAECCRASLAPKLKATTSKANQTPPPPRVGWKVTGRDILPSGHSQLTAINDTTHGGWGGTDLIQSFLCFHSLRVLFLPQTIYFVCDHCREPKAEFKKKTRLKLNTSFVSILSRNFTVHS